MIENINGYLIPTACFFLLFLSVFLLMERYKKSKRAFSTKHSRLSTKISWDTVFTGFAIWAFILFLRKVLYYVPLAGIIQTKSSIWWVHGHVMTFLLLFLAGFIIILRTSRVIKELKDFLASFVTFSFILTIILSALLLSTLPGDFGKRPTEPQTFATLILTPLLFLKMLVSGKYLGVLTSFVVGYFIIDNYEKLNPKKYKVNKKFTAALGGLILVFLIFCVLTFPGDWEKRFLDKAQTAKSKSATEDLLDAAGTIADIKHRIGIFEKIVVDARSAAKKKWANHVFKRVIRTTIQHGEPTDVKEIILTIVRIGEVEADKELCQQAIDVIQTMHPRVRTRLYKKIAAAVAKTVGKKWAKVIFLQLIHAVKTKLIGGWFRADFLKGVLEAALSRKDMKGETEIFTAAIDIANDISYWRNKSLALQAIAVAIKKTGDINWAVSIAQRIPDAEIKENTLTEIQEK